MAARSQQLGGIIHTYQKYDPKNFPSPTQPPPDVVSGAFEHMLAYGDLRQLTDEELARAVRIDPSQIAGLGPSLWPRDAPPAEAEDPGDLRDRPRAGRGRGPLSQLGAQMSPPSDLRDPFQRALKEGQLYDLEQLWYACDERVRSPGNWCSWSTASATSTRSTSWPPSTSSPGGPSCPSQGLGDQGRVGDD